MKKVCVVITARPSYSRIRSALFALNKRSNIELQIVVAASAILDAYGKVVKQIIKDGFNIIAQVHNMISGDIVFLHTLSPDFLSVCKNGYYLPT